MDRARTATRSLTCGWKLLTLTELKGFAVMREQQLSYNMGDNAAVTFATFIYLLSIYF